MDPIINAENVHQLFPDVEPLLNPTAFKTKPISAAESGDFDGYDEEQVRMMDEICIVLTVDDEPIGRASKRVCHLMTNIERGLLHRAFSCFLFDSKKRLLLQQRTDEKVTFPSLWTNTCCSHPLDNPGENGAGFEGAVLGAKVAAQRKLGQELGIRAEQVAIEKFDFLTRVHYRRLVMGNGGSMRADVEIEVNPNKVRVTRWVTPDELRDMLAQPGLKYTPWFKLICESMLFEWWGQLGGEGFEKYKGDERIHRP